MAASAPSVIDWLQLAAPFVAAGLGLLAYNQQKATDRREQLHLEKRQVFAAHIDAMNSYLTSCMRLKDKADIAGVDMAYHVTGSSIAKLLLYADDDVCNSARKFHDKLRAFERLQKAAVNAAESSSKISKERVTVFKEAKVCRNAMIVQMRTELLDGDISSSQKTIKKYFDDIGVD